MTQLDPSQISKVLIRAPNWLGDAVMFAPSLAAIRHTFPHWHLTLLAKPDPAALFEASLDIDEVIIYRDPGIHSRWRGIKRLAKTLQDRKYDLAVLFQNAFEAAIVVRLAGIPFRLGYDTDGRGWLLTHPIARPPHIKRIPLVQYFNELLAVFDITPKTKTPLFHITREEDAHATVMLQDRGIRTTDLLIGLNPGSGHGTAKQWSFRRYAAVADRLVDSTGSKIIILGGPGEEKLGLQVAEAMNAPSVVLSGETSVRELLALLKRCRLLLTNDTGPMHVASALGIPVVAIFGPTDPLATPPIGTNHALVVTELECSPCLLRVCPIDHACMNGIDDQKVFRTAMTLLQRIKLSLVPNIAVFLDRDGTINYDSGYLSDPAALKLLPGAASAIARLNAKGVKTIVVSNQSGVGQGLYTESTLTTIHNRLCDLLRMDAGATLDGDYYCSHHPDDKCQCRKPHPGMVIRASKDLNVDLARSYVIGDKATDIILAANAGMKGLLVLSGHDPDTELNRLDKEGIQPQYIAKGLGEAVDWILSDIRNNARQS